MKDHSVSRRDILRLLSTAAAGTALLPREVFGHGSAPARPPNIVLIMADDMGFSDIGCFGSEIATPNLDRLARGGLRFTQFYNGARCCPTRASLLTGLYPHQAGIGHMVDDRGFPAYQGHLNNTCVTIAEALRPAGYTTLMSGKWHVGEDRPHWPTDRGFDHYFGLISGSSSYFRLDKDKKMATDEQPYTPPEKGYYATDAFTDHALGFLDRHTSAEKPFFLYLPFTSPHWPLHALPEDIDKYRGTYMMGWDELRRQRHERMITIGVVRKEWPLTPRDDRAPAWKDVADKEFRDLGMAVYAAQIDRMDQNIGRVLARLDRMGASDNTLILFLADNGGCAEEINRGTPGVGPGGPDSYWSYGLPWANASNTPFRLYKHWVHEGGISAPLIACWPGQIKSPGSITHQPGHLIDLMATCVDVGKGHYPETFNGRPVTPMEGKSLRPILEGRQRPPHEAMYWEHEGNRAVRQDRWKLVSRYEGGNAWELYDMEADRTETNNLGATNPAKVKELSGLWDAWAARVGVQPWDQVKARQKKG
jgi:arylsulfatase